MIAPSFGKRMHNSQSDIFPIRLTIALNFGKRTHRTQRIICSIR